MDFSTNLLREKFVIRDSSESGSEPVTALSNRMVMTLFDPLGGVSEVFVVRSQMMHTCIRMAAKIADTFFRMGPLMARAEKFDFDHAWHDIIYDHERQFNSNCWVAVYNEGRKIYNSNEYHAFLDIIENCSHKSKNGDYNAAITMAEDIFARKGKKVSISHDANTGMVLDIRKAKARCGMILRSPLRRNNFNFSADALKDRDPSVNVAQALTMASALLEGIHLAFIIGRTNERLRLEIIPKYGDDDKFAVSARRRLARLNAEIKTFENNYHVFYRPEKPGFPEVVVEAEKYTKKLWDRAQLEKEAEKEALEAEEAESDYTQQATL